MISRATRSPPFSQTLPCSTMSQATDSTSPSPATFILLTALSGFCVLAWTVYAYPRPRPALRSVAILVLGDIGRSPRMMYHAESFATNKFLTYLIGYGGESCYFASVRFKRTKAFT